MPHRWEQLRQHQRIRQRPVGHDLDWMHLRRADGALEEPAGRLAVALRDTYTSMTCPI
jgi:hypothetical protein